MNIQLNKENEAKVQEILSINEGLKSKLETIEKQLKKKGKYKN